IRVRDAGIGIRPSHEVKWICSVGPQHGLYSFSDSNLLLQRKRLAVNPWSANPMQYAACIAELKGCRITKSGCIEIPVRCRVEAAAVREIYVSSGHVICSYDGKSELR